MHDVKLKSGPEGREEVPVRVGRDRLLVQAQADRRRDLQDRLHAARGDEDDDQGAQVIQRQRAERGVTIGSGEAGGTRDQRASADLRPSPATSRPNGHATAWSPSRNRDGLQRNAPRSPIRPDRPIRSAGMIDGEPGAEFEDEVVIRRLRWSQRGRRASRSSTPTARATTSCWSGRSRTSRSASGCGSPGVWQDDKRFGMQVKVALAEPVAPVGRAGADRLPQARQAHRRRPGGAAAGALRRRRAGGDRRRPGARVPGRRAEPAARQRGDPLVERAALDARAAPAARAARAGVAGAADRGRVRRPRARGGAHAARTS